MPWFLYTKGTRYSFAQNRNIISQLSLRARAAVLALRQHPQPSCPFVTVLYVTQDGLRQGQGAGLSGPPPRPRTLGESPAC